MYYYILKQLESTFKKSGVILAITLILTACYRVDVPQGNVITAQNLERINIGMSRNEILNELGTPLVADPFHADRWDYFYSVKYLKRSDAPKQNIALIFDGDKLVLIEGEATVTDQNVIEHNEFTANKRKKRGRGLFSRIGDLFSDDEQIQ